jgi:hypothetical protein
MTHWAIQPKALSTAALGLDVIQKDLCASSPRGPTRPERSRVAPESRDFRPALPGDNLPAGIPSWLRESASMLVDMPV